MSGGPIISENTLVGVYVGGPPLPGHYELFCISQLVHKNQFSQAFQSLNQLSSQIRSLYEKLPSFGKLEKCILKITFIDYLLQGETEQNIILQQSIGIQEQVLTLVFNDLLDSYKAFFHKNKSELIELKFGKIFGKFTDFVVLLKSIMIVSENLKHTLVEKLKNHLVILSYFEITIKHEDLQQLFELITQNDYDRLVKSFLQEKLEYFKKKFDSKCADQAYSMVIDYNNPEELTFNTGISLRHPAFIEIIQCADEVNRRSGTQFDTVEEFLNLIS